MLGSNGWPYATNPGFPTSPFKTAPHTLMNAAGERLCFTWNPYRELWLGERRDMSPAVASRDWTYCGPATETDQRKSRNKGMSGLSAGGMG